MEILALLLCMSLGGCNKNPSYSIPGNFECVEGVMIITPSEGFTSQAIFDVLEDRGIKCDPEKPNQTAEEMLPK